MLQLNKHTHGTVMLDNVNTSKANDTNVMIVKPTVIHTFQTTNKQ